jgi:hypothetical protein
MGGEVFDQLRELITFSCSYLIIYLLVFCRLLIFHLLKQVPPSFGIPEAKLITSDLLDRF